MTKPSVRQLIWVFSVLVLLQAIWLDLRLNKLSKQSPRNLLAEQEKKIDDKLRSVPEPSITPEAISETSLWLEPKEASFSGEFTLKVMAKSDKEIKKADLRLFYPANMLKVVDVSWLIDDKVGVASWSGELNKTGEFGVKTISFKTLASGNAQINFDFTKDSLLDSNLLDVGGQDELEEVMGGEYSLK
jgi:hypothetical protein